LITATDVYSVVRHIVRRESSSLDVLNSSTWGLCQQAHERQQILQLTNCSPQTNYSLVQRFLGEHYYFISCPRTFPLRRTVLKHSSDKFNQNNFVVNSCYIHYMHVIYCNPTIAKRT